MHGAPSIALLAVSLGALTVPAAQAGDSSSSRPGPCRNAKDDPGALVVRGDGDTRIEGTRRGDTILAGRGDDVVKGRGGRDLICVGRGRDRVRGGSGSDQVFGEGKDDRLLGNDGGDDLFGGSGDDFLDGGKGRDELDCGSGDDTAHAPPEPGGADDADDCEAVVVGGA